MTRQLLLAAALAVVMALGTWWLGWWAVPVLGAAWGVARYGAYPSATAAAAAGLGWMLLLSVQALRGPMGDGSRILGGALGTPGWVPLLATALFPAGLAAAAARLARCVLPLLEGNRPGGTPEPARPAARERA
jgi:hypothetical protein